jgi:hypothetical protein
VSDGVTGTNDFRIARGCKEASVDGALAYDQESKFPYARLPAVSLFGWLTCIWHSHVQVESSNICQGNPC